MDAARDIKIPEAAELDAAVQVSPSRARPMLLFLSLLRFPRCLLGCLCFALPVVNLLVSTQYIPYRL